MAFIKDLKESSREKEKIAIETDRNKWIYLILDPIVQQMLIHEW
jgi:hypothetical protein